MIFGIENSGSGLEYAKKSGGIKPTYICNKQVYYFVLFLLQVQKEIAEGHRDLAELQRKDWNAYDPNLIAEALFAAANIFSSLKLIYIFTVNPHLGPLQISLGRMILDIMKFCCVYFLVLFSFACGLNHLYWYYATLRSQECQADPSGLHESCNRKFKSFAK